MIDIDVDCETFRLHSEPTPDLAVVCDVRSLNRPSASAECPTEAIVPGILENFHVLWLSLHIAPKALSC